MTKPIDYHIEGLVPELLKQSNYQWFATGRFGLDKLLGNPLNRVDVFSIYVPKEQLKDWESYLKEKGEQVKDQTKVNLRVILIEDYSEFMTAHKDYSPNRNAVLRRLLRHIAEARKNIMQRSHKRTRKVHFPEFHQHLTREGSPNIAPPKRLARDILTSAPRYWDNLVSRLEEEV